MNILKLSPADIEAKIFELVQVRTPGAENLKIISVQQKFLDGSLYTVGFSKTDEAGQTREYINRAYVRKNNIEVYGFDDQLLAIVGATHRNGFGNLFSSPRFMTSLIAAAMTSVIMIWTGLSIYRGAVAEMPTFLTSGFLIILGYYFGKSSNRDEN